MSQPISTSLQIGAIFEILLLSLFGVALPFVIIYYRNTSTRVDQVPSRPLNYDARVGIEDMQGNSSFNTMKAVSVGVMLGLAMLHLFADADENLSTIYPDYPLANLLVCFGIILVLSIDQIALFLWRRLHPIQVNKNINSSLPDHGHDHGHDLPNGHSELKVLSSSQSGRKSVPVPHSQDHDHESHHENCGFMTCEHDVSAGNKGAQKKMAWNEQGVGTERAQSLPLDLGMPALALLQEASFKDIVASYIMEFSIAAHSIIIGVNLGLLGEDDISSIVALMIALGFHQAVEGFGLGAQIAASYFGGSEAGLVGLDTRKVLLFIIVFVCSTPLGVMIGMLSQSQEETDGQIVARGAAEAIGTGSLLYVALVEMLPDVFDRERVYRHPPL
eukprot:gene32300-43143_t